MMFRHSCKSAIAWLENSSMLWTLRSAASGRPMVNAARVYVVISEGTCVLAARSIFRMHCIPFPRSLLLI
jgi:hypothetical protein